MRARRATIGYGIGRFVDRHRVAVALGAAAGMTLVAATLISSRRAGRLAAALQTALSEREALLRRNEELERRLRVTTTATTTAESELDAAS